MSVHMLKVLKLALNCVHDLLDCCKLFIRWMTGTCLVTPPQKSYTDDGSVVIFSFYSDIVNNRAILNIIKEISENMKESLSDALHCVMRWKKFQTVWKDDKEAVVAKWASKSAAQFDKFSVKLSAYR
jgi:dynein heavy chain